MRIAILIILLAALLFAPVILIRFRKRWVAAFNRSVTNRITGRFAGRLRGFGILTHAGRKSGRLYHTPVNVFRAPNGFLIALTYGRESEWVKNVLAAGSCRLKTLGQVYELVAPAIVHDPTRRQFPLFVRSVLGLIGADDFMQLSIRKRSLSCAGLPASGILEKHASAEKHCRHRQRNEHHLHGDVPAHDGGKLS